MKTHHSLLKRFKQTGSGRLRRLRSSAQHLARRKSRRARKLALEYESLPIGEQRLLRKFFPGI